METTVRRALLVAGWTALLAAPAPAVTIEWVPIGNPGNAPVPTKCFVPDCGSVAYEYSIVRYETTNAQYAEFLNAVDAQGTNTLALYNANMSSDATFGGIHLVPGNAPGSKYVVESGFEDKLVTHVSFFDALRFANWMHNGQGSGDTETSAYTLLGGPATPSNGAAVMRNLDARVFLGVQNPYDALPTTELNFLGFAWPPRRPALRSARRPSAAWPCCAGASRRPADREPSRYASFATG